MTVYVADRDFTLHLGDVADVLAQLPDESVHCVVTSPPYWGLRDYSACGCVAEGRLEVFEDGRGDRHTAGGAIAFHRQGSPNPECADCKGTGKRKDVSVAQLGLEPTPDAYVARMVDVFRQVRRVLRRDGTCWLNLGDSYHGGGYANHSVNGDAWLEAHGGDRRRTRQQDRINANPCLKPKDLVGIPWRVAFALQADGWYLRSDIVWAKPNPMPESVTDRPTKTHEYLFLLTRSPRYFYDQEAVREPHTRGWSGASGGVQRNTVHGAAAHQGLNGDTFNPAGRNARSVWEIATQPYAEAHFATFPEELPRRCIAAGCPADGTVLDPFMGSGTVALVARRLGRRSIGIELNPEYARLAARRLQQLSLLAEAGA